LHMIWMKRRAAACLGSLALVVVAVAVPIHGFAQMETDGRPARAKWSAQWISHPTAPLRDPVTLHFKKAIELSAVPAHFIVHVSADNRFVLYLNGERVGDGPARGDLTHWRYETFDLAPMLKAGTNVLAATVWNFGVYAPVAQMSDRTAFLVEGDTAAEKAVNTDKSWMVEVEPGQVPLPRRNDGFYAYMAMGPGETLHAGEYDWDWMSSAAAEGSRWVPAGPALRENIFSSAGIAASRGVTADVPWALIPDPLPHMAYEAEDPGHVVRSDAAGAQTFPAQGVTLAAHTHTHIMLDRAELTTAYPKLLFSGGKGAHVVLTYAEALYDKQQHKGNRNEVGDRQAIGLMDDIYPDGGAHRVFETLWWRTWRYLDIDVETADAALTLDGMEAHYTAYPFKVTAKFHASDAELDKIWQIGWHTAQLDAHETYMDTPYYEQLQYAGDTRLQAMITYAMTGTDLLPRQAIEALNDSRIPAGITESRYPSALPQLIPPFSLLWIGMLHDNYMYRPDTQFVQEILPGTRTVLDWFASYQHDDGVLGKLPWWSFVDWIETETKRDFPAYDSNHESCLTTMQYIGALEDAIDLEKALGSPEHVAIDSARLERAKKGVVAQCWDASKQLFADNAARDMYSEHTNMLAVLNDVAPKKDWQAIMKRVVARRVDGSDGTKAAGDPPLIGSSFYFRYYLARALDHAGMGNEYLKTLGDWRGFLKMGFTTWPEQPGNTRSDSHAWTAHPTYDLLTLVAGIEPASPGFKTVRIAPHLGDLTYLEATYPHEMGLIHVKYAVNGGALHAEVELPEGLTGEFVWKGKATTLRGGKATLELR
jgi:alpha-L-rhamnosidase